MQNSGKHGQTLFARAFEICGSNVFVRSEAQPRS